MPTPYRTFLALYDTHWGYERKGGHKVALHDAKAISCALKFARDFAPDVVILGGDILDCGAVSHHERHKPGMKEGLRLLDDAKECRKAIIAPVEALEAEEYHYIIGNHEDWLGDLEMEIPGIQGMLTIERLLELDARWNVEPQGGFVHLGKMTFIHGDTLKGGEYMAKGAVIDYERNIRFGHFHTAQQYTKTSPLSAKMGKTGVCVPCLCRKDPAYGERRPNKWVQGFNFGYVLPDGTFHDYLAIITNGRTVVNGKVYVG